MKPVTRTFQMRLPGDQPALALMAQTYQRAMRTLYAESKRTGKSFDSLKTEYCRRFGVSGRQFNAIKTDLAGKVSSVREKAAYDLEAAEEDLAKTLDRIAKADKAKQTARDELREKRDVSQAKIRKQSEKKVHLSRKRQRLEAKTARLRKTIAASHPPMCFGSRRAFNAQHHLEENGFGNHGAWLMHWRLRRSSEFQVIGSDDEASGNKTCRARIENDGVHLKLTTIGGEKTEIGPLVLPYGHDEWLEAIRGGDAEARVAQKFQSETAKMVERYTERGWPADVMAKAQEDGIAPEKAFRRMRSGLRKKSPKLGYAISYRFKRDTYGWRMFVTIQEPVRDVRPDYTNGAIGVDMNADHLALVSVNRLGVLVGFTRIDTHVSHKSTGQRLAIYREAAASIVQRASAESRPIVVEDLDFRAKRRRLGEIGSAKSARMLSSFATNMFKAAIVSAAKRAGVALVFVNPAFTSVVGLTRAVKCGVSVHLGAALTIARRAIGFGEALSQEIRIPAGHLKPDVLPVPAELQSKPLDIKGMRTIAFLIKGVLAARPKRQTGAERRLLRSESAFLAGLTFDTG